MASRPIRLHPLDADEIEAARRWYSERNLEGPVAIDGNIVASRGLGTSIAFALAVVERLAGTAKRDEVEAGLVLVH